jgi:hypothetical protein
MTRSRRMAPQPCPACRRKLDAAAAADRSGARPKVGDLSVCLYCGARLRYGLGLVLELTDETGDTPGEIERIERAVALLRQTGGTQ